jgi:hypothetical protein
LDGLLLLGVNLLFNLRKFGDGVNLLFNSAYDPEEQEADQDRHNAHCCYRKNCKRWHANQPVSVWVHLICHLDSVVEAHEQQNYDCNLKDPLSYVEDLSSVRQQLGGFAYIIVHDQVAEREPEAFHEGVADVLHLNLHKAVMDKCLDAAKCAQVEDDHLLACLRLFLHFELHVDHHQEHDKADQPNQNEGLLGEARVNVVTSDQLLPLAAGQQVVGKYHIEYL